MIFVTGYMDDAVDSIDLKEAKLIWKPFQKDELLQVVGDSVATVKTFSHKKDIPKNQQKTKSDAPPAKSQPVPQPPPLPTQPVEVAANGSCSPDGRQCRNGHRILFIDDDEALCKAGVRALEQDGIEVVVSMTLEDARSSLSGETFDTIVLDIQLPDGNGLDLLDETGTTPVIVVTGAPTGESAKRAVQGRVLAFLPKPVGPDELRSRVRGAIDEGRISQIRRKLLASRYGGNEFIDDLHETERIFERALSSLCMVYQPIVRAEDHSVYGYEALLRCHEPKLSSPLKFLAVAEILDRVEDVGRAVRASVASTMLCHTEQLETIFINLHPCELNAGLLVHHEDALLPLAPRVVLEVTERASLQSGQRLTSELKKLRDLGYRIAVDDLGEGYAGLASLVSVRPDIVKIDMSLVRNLHLAPLQIDIVDAIIDMAHRAGITVVGEGVEIKEERDILVGLGCDLLQGYFVGEPAEPFSTINQELSKK